MKVLLVNGSPHKEGCTYTALCEVADTLNQEGIETEIFWIGNKPIGGCIACKACTKSGKCVFDDVVNRFREKAYGADGFQEMPVVSSRYWNMVHGASPEQVKQDAEGLYTMRVLGRNMSYMLRCQETARKAGVALPKQETPVFTNFVR